MDKHNATEENTCHGQLPMLGGSIAVISFRTPIVLRKARIVRAGRLCNTKVGVAIHVHIISGALPRLHCRPSMVRLGVTTHAIGGFERRWMVVRFVLMYTPKPIVS